MIRKSRKPLKYQHSFSSWYDHILSYIQGKQIITSLELGASAGIREIVCLGYIVLTHLPPLSWFYFCYCDKNLDLKQVRGKQLISAHSSRLLPTTVGKSEQQESHHIESREKQIHACSLACLCSIHSSRS